MSSAGTFPLRLQLLLDTNILLDALLQREPFVEGWKTLLVMQEFGDADLWVSAKSFTDVFYVASQRMDSHALQGAFIARLERLHACSITEDDIQAAARAQWDDFEDCLVARAAEKVKADFIVTRDLSGFSQSQISACTPTELVEHVKEEYGIEYADLDLVA